jgi:hypothetical protein
MKQAVVLVVASLALATMVGCAPGPNPLVNTPDEAEDVAGFWQCLWHGIIAPITFIVSLFSDGVHVYDVHNNGNWYNLGFLVGLSVIFGGGGGGAASRSRRG